MMIVFHVLFLSFLGSFLGFFVACPCGMAIEHIGKDPNARFKAPPKPFKFDPNKTPIGMKFIDRIVELGEKQKKKEHLSEFDIAILKNDRELVEKMIKEGAKVNPKDPQFGTPLMHAVFTNNLEMVQLLVKHGAIVTTRAKHGIDAFTLAVLKNYPDIAIFLGENGADLKREFEGMNLADIAGVNKHEVIAGFLSSRNIFPKFNLSLPPSPSSKL